MDCPQRKTKEILPTQGVTKVYFGWPIAPSDMSPNAGGGGCGVSANEYRFAHGAQINFGDLTPIYPTHQSAVLCMLASPLLSVTLRWLSKWEGARKQEKKFILQKILIFAFFPESTLQESKTSAVDQEKMIKETKMSMMQVTGELKWIRDTS